MQVRVLSRRPFKHERLTMELGFSGSRDGMTYAQVITVFRLLGELKPEKVHHGDCVGADHDFHSIATYLDIPIKGHPPTDSKLRAFCPFKEAAEEKGYLDRNKDIVNESDLLLATPKEASEQWRGGTWSTIRYAKKNKKSVIIVWPNGLTETIAP
jgi:hypothetical protein